jgi:hypothetical protein
VEDRVFLMVRLKRNRDVYDARAAQRGHPNQPQVQEQEEEDSENEAF